MEQLIDIVTDYVRGKIGTGTAWYGWSFNADRVPPGILGGAMSNCDWYASNVDLKHRLNEVWLTSPGRRQELEHYYIRDWGGVRTNKQATLTSYYHSCAEQNIARGKAGIASWSKALCVRDPLQYAIFDARVSASLNALQVIHRTVLSEPMRFPGLPSRNTTVKRTARQLRSHFGAHAWPSVRSGFYADYLTLCKSAAVRLGKPGEPLPMYAIEMALFAHTEELLDLAFPH